MSIQWRYLISNLRNDWWETIMWRFMAGMTIILLATTAFGFYVRIIPFSAAITLGVAYSVFLWICKRNWKFQKRKDGTLL